MPDFDETLLSAYLDGELPPDERARVEAWLAEQPEGRQVLEELRSIKTSLERLPRDRLPHDFAEQVLRQAEREMLTSSGDDRQMRGFSWRRLRRPVLWASLTLAAGLLLMVFDRDRQPPAPARQVALAPREAHDGPAIGAPAGEAAKSGDRLSDELPGSSVATGPASGPAAMPPADESQPREGEPRGRMREPGMKAGAAGNSGGRMRRTGRSVPDALPRMDEVNQALVRDAEEGSATLSDRAMLVWCEVSPNTQYNERFRQLLHSNSITWSDAAQDGGFSGQVAQWPNQRRLLAAGQAALKADAELVLVEASEPQVKAVLAELNRDNDVFKAVDVEPAADAPRQQQFGQYRRGAIPAGQLRQRKTGALKKEPADKAQADGAPDEPAANEAKQTSQQGIAYQLRAGGDASGPALQLKAPDEMKRAPLEAGGNRLQVLFVLQPAGDAKPAAAPPNEKQQD